MEAGSRRRGRGAQGGAASQRVDPVGEEAGDEECVQGEPERRATEPGTRGRGGGRRGARAGGAGAARDGARGLGESAMASTVISI